MRICLGKICLLSLFLVGCVETQSPSEQDFEIIGGTPTNGHKSVVALLAIDENGSQTLCTATSIAPNLLLTAARCVHPDIVGIQAQFHVLTGSDVTDPQGSCPCDGVSAVHIHPDFNPNWLHGGHDIALAVTDKDLGVPPAAINQNSLSDNNLGLPVTVLGYGIGRYLENSEAGIKRQVELQLHGINGLFVRSGRLGANACHGDWGGPVIGAIEGQEVIIGVNSFAMANCLYAGRATRVDTHSEFLEPFLEQCADSDGDGYNDISCGGHDCDDTNPVINPGAEDVCGDGIDQNCDGLDRVCVCNDQDGDGFGQGQDCLGADCNDQDLQCWEGYCCDPSPCLVLSNCGLACDPNDQDCLFSCFFDAQATDSVLIMELVACGAAHDCQDTDCFFTHCNTLYEGCLAGCYDQDQDEYGLGSSCQALDCDDAHSSCQQGYCCPTGLSCNELISCLGNCSADDSACSQGCWVNATISAKVASVDLSVCILEWECSTLSCILTRCRPELVQCNNN